MSASNDIGQWYKSIPPITRVWFTAAIAVPLAARLGIVSPVHLVLFIKPIVQNFQIWRLLTSVLFYPMGFNYLISLFFIYQYSSRLETSTFSGKPADYVFCLFFLWICNLIGGSILSLYVLMDAMILSVMYIWCQLNKEQMMSFWFGMQFKAMYMPWVILVFQWIVSGSFLVQLLGIVVGHLYFFLVFKYPIDFNGPQLLQTPNFLYRYFPSTATPMGGFGSAPASRARPATENNDANRPRQAFAGRGYVLGDQ